MTIINEDKSPIFTNFKINKVGCCGIKFDQSISSVNVIILSLHIQKENSNTAYQYNEVSPGSPPSHIPLPGYMEIGFVI